MSPAKASAKASAKPSAALPLIALCLVAVAMLWAALLFDASRSGTSALKQAGGAGLTLVIVVALSWFLARQTR
jgi:hypothetical protein